MVQDTGIIETTYITNDNSMGENNAGQLGIGSTTPSASNVPRQIYAAGALSGKYIKSIYGGSSSTFILTSDNNVFAIGAGTNYVLGTGSTTSQFAPKLVSALIGKQIIQALITAQNGFFLGSDGTIYGCGVNAVSEFK
jgi:alpha-tubulin suppressor-like RCC1 family protein